MTNPTKALLVACLATLILASNTKAASPDLMIAQATSNNIIEIVKAKTFAVVEFEVDAEEQTITPFGEDVEVNQNVAAVMAMPSNLLACIDDCSKSTQSGAEYEACVQTCRLLFPNGISIGN